MILGIEFAFIVACLLFNLRKGLHRICKPIGQSL